jgi:magnesium transporter
LDELEKTENDVEEENEFSFEALHEKRIEEMTELLEEKKMKQLQIMLEENDEFDVAEFLSELPEQQMAMVFRMLSKEQAAAVFAELESEEQEYIINSITDKELGGILEELYLDDTVDMMEELPANVVKRVMRIATPETRKLINQYLNYPENSAGTIMTAEFIDLKKYMSVKESFARIRRIGADKETIYTCFVTSADRKLEGIVTVKDLIMADEDAVIESIMDENVIFCTTTDDQEDVSGMFSDYDLLAIPVVDKEGCLVGIVTVDDVIDVMEQEATEDIEKMAGITPSDRPYSRTSVVEIWKNRIPWLMFLMLSATFTGMIMTHFEDALAVQVVLAAFIPMLMGTGGNSGSQASTAVIRSLSLGDIEPSDVIKVVWKELRVAFLCGVTLAVINFGKMYLVDRTLLNNPEVTFTVAAIVSLTIVFVVMFAKVVGSTLPIIAEKIGVDPAVMASPLISTITDAVSLMIYFNIARILIPALR